MNFKRMGVMNITPNSFSDGGELSVDNFQQKLKSFGSVEAIDIGAESTAPMNASIAWETEWERIEPYMPLLKAFKGILSFDTYHPETIEEILRYYVNNSWDQAIWWNDVSGKMDGFVKDFLELSPNFSYVLCHNLAPNRTLTGKHMDYVDPELTLDKVADYLRPFAIPQVIFDPCLGFSKTYEQNWMILNKFDELQKITGHNRWLLGFSRKSFLRKKYNLDASEREKLDQAHVQELQMLKNNSHSELWIRTHRPDLL
jgi:dihydropteroate synthase